MSETCVINESEWAVWRALEAMRRQLDHALELQLQQSGGLSASEFQVLAALMDAPDGSLRSGDLAALIGWEKSRLSHQARRMQARGLVKRIECESDLRGTWVTATDAGREAMAAAMPARVEAMRRMFFNAVADEEQQVLARVADKVLAAINPPACEVAARVHGDAERRADTSAVASVR